MNKQLFQFLESIPKADANTVDSILVTSFILANGIKVKNNKFIKSLIQRSHYVDDFILLLKRTKENFDFEELIKAFEYVISPSDKVVNGAVYTPEDIRENIVDRILIMRGYKKDYMYADISCGCGGSFFTLAKRIKKEYPYIKLAELYSQFIGIDIAEYSIQRTKILLSLYALWNGEDTETITFNLFVHNTLDFDFSRIPIVAKHGIDAVLGNPPYVGINNISQDNRALLKKWSFTSAGKADMYLAFLQIGLEILNPDGILSFITVNTFITSLNGREFRKYLSSKGFEINIIDFGDEQIFRKCSTYTCICTITKRREGYILYTKSERKRLTSLAIEDYSKIEYSQVNDKDGWHLLSSTEREIINRIESTGIPINKKYQIRTGFATLKNDIYLFTPVGSSDDFLILEKDGIKFPIEKKIIRKAVNPNILKNEDDLNNSSEYIIYPYQIKDAMPVLIEENEFKTLYPFAYKYLVSYKEPLEKRNDGMPSNQWYAYGRTQSLNNDSYKLLFPEMASIPRFILSKDKELMYYNGSAILSDDYTELVLLKIILSSSIFRFYIEKTSKPYSGGFFAISKRYIKNFGCPDLTPTQNERLMSYKRKSSIDRFLCDIYDVPYTTITK